MKNELAIMKLLNHPNIVKLEEEFEDDEYHHCVLEYIHVSVYTYVCSGY